MGVIEGFDCSPCGDFHKAGFRLEQLDDIYSPLI